MVVKPLEYFGVLNILGNAKHVLVCKLQGAILILFQFNEFLSGNFALGASLGGGVTFVDISAYGASEFSHIDKCVKC